MVATSQADPYPNELATSEYWDSRYALSDHETPDHEWFKTSSALRPFFQRHLLTPVPSEINPKLLHLGSGDSAVPADLAALGYRNQLCLDFSSVVVESMSKRALPGVEWRHADVRDMTSVADESIDVAFDKGTMDAMIHGDPWDPPADVRANTAAYMRELARVLQVGGVFLYITYRQPHFIRPLLNVHETWSMDMETLSDSEGGFDYYAWILKRRPTTAPGARSRRG